MPKISLKTELGASNGDLNANETLEVNKKRKTESNGKLNGVASIGDPWEAKMEDARKLMTDEIHRLRNENLKCKEEVENTKQKLKTAEETVNKYGKQIGFPDGTFLWNSIMKKATEYEAKENEMNELRQEKTNLIEKNKTEATKKDQALAQLTKQVTDEKNKCDRIRKIAQTYKEEAQKQKEDAQKYKASDSQKTTRIEELEASGGLGRACEWGGAGGRLQNRGWGSGYG